MNKPKYNIGDTVYYLDVGVHRKTVNGIYKDEEKWFYELDRNHEYSEGLLYGSLKDLQDFLCKEIEKFKEPDGVILESVVLPKGTQITSATIDLYEKASKLTQEKDGKLHIVGIEKVKGTYRFKTNSTASNSPLEKRKRGRPRKVQS